jgi:hypothetical protein
MMTRASLVLCFLSASFLSAQVQAPDASSRGPSDTGVGSYELPETDDNRPPNMLPVAQRVLPGCNPIVALYDCKIQVKARIFYPTPLDGMHPLILLLHGNHGTCGHAYGTQPNDPPGLLGFPRVDFDILFTGLGRCLPPNPIVVPSSFGYDYLADQLASWGYIVVSIDANRGIGGIDAPLNVLNDPKLIRARGVLVLRHLQQLSGWNRNGGTPSSVGVELQNHVDFSNVGLMGHSRGGEGVRAAFNLYEDPTQNWQPLIPGLTVRGIFEIAPTDFGTTETGAPEFQAIGLAWGVLLPMCDGDVSTLEGVRPFDRAILNLEPTPLQKSTYTVWGANHNFFNSEWQLSDGNENVQPGGKPGPGGTYAPICAPADPTIGNIPIFEPSPGSAQQQLVAMSSVLAFFRGNVGLAGAKFVSFNQNFNPPFGIPKEVNCSTLISLPPCNGMANKIVYPTRTDRGYSPPGALLVFDDFKIRNSYQKMNVNFSVGQIPNKACNMPPPLSTCQHDPSLLAGNITWAVAGVNTFWQSNWTKVGQPGVDITKYKTLDIRVSRQDDMAKNKMATTDFSIQLVGANGMMTGSLLLSAYTDPNFANPVPSRKSTLAGPVGSIPGVGGLHPILQTVRIPLTAFGNFNNVGPQLRGVRLVFNQTASGAIYVANLRISKEIGGGANKYPGGSEGSGAIDSSEDWWPAPLSTSPIVHPCSVRTVHLDYIPELGSSGWEIIAHSDDVLGVPYVFPPRDASPLMIITPPSGTTQYTFDVGHDPIIQNYRIFSLTETQFGHLPPGSAVKVQYVLGSALEYWKCGSLP